MDDSTGCRVCKWVAGKAVGGTACTDVAMLGAACAEGAPACAYVLRKACTKAVNSTLDALHAGPQQACTALGACGSPPATVASSSSCRFYEDLENLTRCGPQGYALHFGLPHCEKYKELESTLSEVGQRWSRYVRGCLQQKLQAPYLNGAESCSDIQAIALRSHMGCYLDGPVSFCELPIADQFAIASNAALTPDTVKQGVALIAECLGHERALEQGGMCLMPSGDAAMQWPSTDALPSAVPHPSSTPAAGLPLLYYAQVGMQVWSLYASFKSGPHVETSHTTLHGTSLLCQTWHEHHTYHAREYHEQTGQWVEGTGSSLAEAISNASLAYSHVWEDHTELPPDQLQPRGLSDKEVFVQQSMGSLQLLQLLHVIPPGPPPLVVAEVAYAVCSALDGLVHKYLDKHFDMDAHGRHVECLEEHHGFLWRDHRWTLQDRDTGVTIVVNDGSRDMAMRKLELEDLWQAGVLFDPDPHGGKDMGSILRHNRLDDTLHQLWVHVHDDTAHLTSTDAYQLWLQHENVRYAGPLLINDGQPFPSMTQEQWNEVWEHPLSPSQLHPHPFAFHDPARWLQDPSSSSHPHHHVLQLLGRHEELLLNADPCARYRTMNMGDLSLDERKALLLWMTNLERERYRQGKGDYSNAALLTHFSHKLWEELLDSEHWGEIAKLAAPMWAAQKVIYIDRELKAFQQDALRWLRNTIVGMGLYEVRFGIISTLYQQTVVLAGLYLFPGVPVNQIQTYLSGAMSGAGALVSSMFKPSSFALLVMDVGVSVLTPSVLSTVLASCELVTSPTGIGLIVFGVRVALGLTCRIIRHCLLKNTQTRVGVVEERIFLSTVAAVRGPLPKHEIGKWRRAVQTLRLRTSTLNWATAHARPLPWREQQLWQCNALASQAHRLFRKTTQNASCMAADPNLGRWLCDQRQRLRSMGVRASRHGTSTMGWC